MDPADVGAGDDGGASDQETIEDVTDDVRDDIRQGRTAEDIENDVSS